jgi:hypothetical protein
MKYLAVIATTLAIATTSVLGSFHCVNDCITSSADAVGCAKYVPKFIHCRLSHPSCNSSLDANCLKASPSFEGAVRQCVEAKGCHTESPLLIYYLIFQADPSSNRFGPTKSRRRPAGRQNRQPSGSSSPLNREARHQRRRKRSHLRYQPQHHLEASGLQLG